MWVQVSKGHYSPFSPLGFAIFIILYRGSYHCGESSTHNVLDFLYSEEEMVFQVGRQVLQAVVFFIITLFPDFLSLVSKRFILRRVGVSRFRRLAADTWRATDFVKRSWWQALKMVWNGGWSLVSWWLRSRWWTFWCKSVRRMGVRLVPRLTCRYQPESWCFTRVPCFDFCIPSVNMVVGVFVLIQDGRVLSRCFRIS